jgi:hypothetical protein
MGLKRERTVIFGLSALFIFSVFFLFTGQADAKVKGVCSNCHTMHNSQNGNDMVQDPVPGAKLGGDCQGCHYEPREELLTYTCVGCHAKDTGGPTIDSPGTLDIPQIFYAEGGNELAAGNFSYIVSRGDASGHNVHGFGLVEGILPDIELGGVPPGYVPDMDPSGYNYLTDYPSGLALNPGPVMCAGAYGCHGNRTIESQSKATFGTHHADDSVLRIGDLNFNQANQGLTPGTSYRYLSGVKGGEISDWENSVSTVSHNEYFGAILGAAEVRDDSPAVTSVETMSQFCASCHGNFHMAGLSDGRGISTGGTNASPWIRHPTDIMIPNTAPYDAMVSYELSARVARVNLTASNPEDSDVGTNAVVFCLSCHKAHASEFSDMLRFSYGTMLTGTSGASAGTGCFACHNDKDGI